MTKKGQHYWISVCYLESAEQSKYKHVYHWSIIDDSPAKFGKSVNKCGLVKLTAVWSVLAGLRKHIPDTLAHLRSGVTRAKCYFSTQIHSSSESCFSVKLWWNSTPKNIWRNVSDKKNKDIVCWGGYKLRINIYTCMTYVATIADS